ncbi:MAG: hypothetical protein K6B40_00660 [Firmicutes bacterium]|nr:hypothetical protein [Bacillota bacterium]
MMKNKYIAFALFVVLVIAFWNLFEYLFSTFITGNVYQFSAGNDLGFPLAVAAVMGYLLFLHKKSK